MAKTAGVSVLLDRLPFIAKNIHDLGKYRVLVGVPEEKGERKDSDEITNAALAYIHDNGAPEANIPARPFMKIGIRKIQDEAAEKLKIVGQEVLDGVDSSARRGLAVIGMLAVKSIQGTIREGVPPPLSPITVARRRIRSPGSKYRRKATSPDEVTPLYDTGQLLRAVTYVLEPRKGK